MVFVIDEGSTYKAPIDRIWKLIQAHGTDGLKIHPDQKNPTGQQVNENTNILTWENEMQGKMVKTKVRLTAFPPLGLVIEILEGPMAGSKAFNFYTPKGEKTAVTVVGDWQSPMMSGDQLKKAVLSFLEKEYNEDVKYLSTMS